MTDQRRRPMVISPLWLQGVILTFLFGFTILGYLALRVYQDHAPIPAKVVSEKTGETVFTGDDVLQGQEAFLTYGLMEYGSIYGHGAYLGPDFTADYLHRAGRGNDQGLRRYGRAVAGPPGTSRPTASIPPPTC